MKIIKYNILLIKRYFKVSEKWFMQELFEYEIGPLVVGFYSSKSTKWGIDKFWIQAKIQIHWIRTIPRIRGFTLKYR